jgi:hypothetical protein
MRQTADGLPMIRTGIVDVILRARPLAVAKGSVLFRQHEDGARQGRTDPEGQHQRGHEHCETNVPSAFCNLQPASRAQRRERLRLMSDRRIGGLYKKCSEIASKPRRQPRTRSGSSGVASDAIRTITISASG